MKLLTVAEVASLLRTSPNTVHYWLHTGKAPRSIKVGRLRLFDERDVFTWLDECATGPDDSKAPV